MSAFRNLTRSELAGKQSTKQKRSMRIQAVAFASLAAIALAQDASTKMTITGIDVW